MRGDCAKDVKKARRRREVRVCVEEDRLLAVWYDEKLGNTLSVLQKRWVKVELAEDGRMSSRKDERNGKRGARGNPPFFVVDGAPSILTPYSLLLTPLQFEVCHILFVPVESRAIDIPSSLCPLVRTKIVCAVHVKTTLEGRGLFQIVIVSYLWDSSKAKSCILHFAFCSKLVTDETENNRPQRWPCVSNMSRSFHMFQKSS